MYISTTKAKGITYVRLMESRWDKDKKRSRPVVLKNFGRLDELTKGNPNALEELKVRIPKNVNKNSEAEDA